MEQIEYPYLNSFEYNPKYKKNVYYGNDFRMNENEVKILLEEKILFNNCNSPLTQYDYNMMLKNKKVYFGYLFNQEIAGKIPDNITEISFKDYRRDPADYSCSIAKARENDFNTDSPNEFNQPICINSEHSRETCNCLPKNLECIEFGECFNHPIDNLPNTLQKLKISYLFNKSLDNLPENLTYLSIEGLFNKSVDNLPKFLITLIIECHNFNQKLDNLPNSLKYLEIFSCNFNQSIDLLPSSLETLILNTTGFTKRFDNLPNSLKILILNLNIYHDCINNLPDSIEILDIIMDYNTIIKKLPKNLIKFNKKFINSEEIEEYIKNRNENPKKKQKYDVR